MLDDRSLKLIDAIRRVAPAKPSGLNTASITELRERIGRPLRVGLARVDGIGDWILTVPLIESLRAHPAVGEVVLFAPNSHRSLLDNERVTFVPIDVWAAHHTPWPHGSLGKVLAISAVGQGRTQRAGRAVDVPIDLLVLPRWDTDRGQNLRFFGAGLGAPIAGHDPAISPQSSPKERRDGRVLSIVHRDGREFAHESDRLESLRVGIGAPETPAGAARAFFGLPAERATPANRVVMHTGAHDSFRRWPLEHWEQLIRNVLENSDAEVRLIGDARDAQTHGGLCALDHERVSSVAGSVPLSGLPAVLDDASVFIGSDSGPAHFAAAIDLPTIVISCFPEGDDAGHPNSPARFAARSRAGGAVLQPQPIGTPFAALSGEERDGLIASVSPAQAWAALNPWLTGDSA